MSLWRTRRPGSPQPDPGSANLLAEPAFRRLLGTKLRALYQRSKGRDLFDLDLALSTLPLDDAAVVRCFTEYLARSAPTVSRAELEANLDAKLASPAFLRDVGPLLPAGTTYDPHAAAALVRDRLIAKLPQGRRRRRMTRGMPGSSPTS